MLSLDYEKNVNTILEDAHARGKIPKSAEKMAKVRRKRGVQRYKSLGMCFGCILNANVSFLLHHFQTE